MQMPARRFFSMQRYIKQLRARKNYDLWLMTNLCNFTDQKFKEKVIQEVTRAAFPDSETAKPYWDNPEPGLKQIK
jgi:hypothetical protein